MRTTLILLGTGGGPTPKVTRSAPAQVVTVGDAAYLIDAGNGVARQLTLAGVPFRDLRTVAVTHHHSDHIADLGTLPLLAWGADLAHAIDVYGPPPLSAMLAAYLDFADTDVSTRIADEGRPPLLPLVRGHEFAPPARPTRVYEDDRARITTVAVHHPPMAAVGYRIDTDDGAIVVSGDTAPCDALVELATGADLLVHEAIHLPSLDFPLARTNGSRLREHLVDSHTTPADAGRIAERAGVRTLVLSHLVPADAGVPDGVWRAEAARGFRGRVVVGADLMSFVP